RGAPQVGPREIRPGEVRTAQVRLEEVALHQPGLHHPGPGQDGHAEAGAPQIGAGQIGTAEVATGKISRLAPRHPLQPEMMVMQELFDINRIHIPSLHPCSLLACFCPGAILPPVKPPTTASRTIPYRRQTGKVKKWECPLPDACRTDASRPGL